MTNNGYRKYFFNENYFKNITPNSAYVLGLWWADGCITYVHNNLREFSITLSEEDIELLEKIKTELQYTGPIQKHSIKNAYNIRLTSYILCEDILNLNGSPNKSKLDIWPAIDNKYLPYFIRGLFDGDGGIHIKKNKNDITYISKITSGNRSFLIKLQNCINKFNSDITGCIYDYEEEFRAWYCLTFNQYETKLLGKLMYIDPCNLYMLRKYQKFQDMYKLKGEHTNQRSNNCKLNDELIIEILTDVWNGKYKYISEIAKTYNMNQNSIKQIFTRKSWRHVTCKYDLDLIITKFKRFGK